MHLSQLVSLSLIATTVLASDCNNAANFNLKAGMSFPIVTKSAASADNSLTTSVTGNVVIIDQCTLQLTGLTLANAPDTANIQLYGMGTNGLSFPISKTVLSGTYNQAAGPLFTLLDTSYFEFSSTSPGIAFVDFTSIRVYAVSKQWVIAETTLKNGVQTVVSSASSTFSALPTPAANKIAQSAKSSASGLSMVVVGVTILFAIAASINI